VRFGGHKQAAGLTLKTAEFQEFYAKILEYAEINLTEEDLEYKLVLDAELDESQLSIVTCQLLQQLEPFGVGNPKPKFLISGMEIKSARQVGANKQHAQLQLQKGERQVSAIAFNFNPLEKSFKVGDTIDVAAELIADQWNGRQEVKLKIVDVRSNKKV
jgi:single-stranded-DNA-specific exonuclease